MDLNLFSFLRLVETIVKNANRENEISIKQKSPKRGAIDNASILISIR